MGWVSKSSTEKPGEPAGYMEECGRIGVCLMVKPNLIPNLGLSWADS